MDVGKYITSSHLEIMPAGTLSESILLFESAVKELLKEGSGKSFSEGFSGFRTNLDVKGTENPFKACFEGLEKILEDISQGNGRNFTFLCTFPLEELSGSALLELVEEKGVLVNRKGKWEYLVNTCDVNGQKELEITLLKAKKDAEATNRAKNSFIMNMSHELRTPLNSVIGFSDLLLEGAFGPLNTKQSKYVNNILISGKNLLEIINNLLDISRLEAGWNDTA